MEVIAAIVLLAVIVLVHELGHFVASILVKVPVQSLSLGLPFGPRLRWPIGSYEFQLTLIPLGAATNMEEGVLEEAPLWKQVVIYLAGPLANLLSVFVLAVFFFGLNSGLQVASLVISTEAATMLATGTEFVPVQDVSGPVGIIAFCARLIAIDPVQGLQFGFLLLSGALGLSNLLPIPALDGGEVVMNFLVRYARLSRAWAKRISNISIFLLITLVVVISIKDVGRLLP